MMANIISHRAEDGHGNVLMTYEWDGPVNEPVLISKEFIIYIDQLPWPLLEIESDEYDWFYGRRKFVRLDAGFPALYYWVAGRWHVHQRHFLRFQQRLILTCHLWGIGYVERDEIPHWGCLARRSRFK